MVNWKRWWTGPESDKAWQYSGNRSGATIRVWPVKFSNRENFEKFYEALLDSKIFDYYGEENVSVNAWVQSDQHPGRTLSDPKKFLMGQSPRALKQISLGAQMNLNEQRGVNFAFKGSFKQESSHRGPKGYVEVFRYGPLEMRDFPAYLDVFERLIEGHTEPMNLWDRATRKPAVSRHSEDKHDERKERKSTQWSSWIGSGVIAVIAAYLTGVWSK